MPKNGRFDYERIDEVIHGRMRLGLLAYLSAVENASFVELKASLNATAGNISANLSKLETAGYVSIGKTFRANRPYTTVSLTSAGRKAWAQYLDHLNTLVRSQSGARAAPSDPAKGAAKRTRSG